MTDCGKPIITADGDRIVIRVPMSFKRRGGRKEIIVPEGLIDDHPRPNRNRPLAVAVARGHRWQRLLEEGKFRTVSALARQVGVDASQVSRTIHLAFLCPDIVKAIICGGEPTDTSIQDFAGAPVIWAEQRKSFGFPATSSISTKAQASA